MWPEKGRGVGMHHHITPGNSQINTFYTAVGAQVFTTLWEVELPVLMAYPDMVWACKVQSECLKLRLENLFLPLFHPTAVLKLRHCRSIVLLLGHLPHWSSSWSINLASWLYFGPVSPLLTCLEITICGWPMILSPLCRPCSRARDLAGSAS